jgi:hypothetical protein
MDTLLQKRLSVEDSRSLLEKGVKAAKSCYGSVDSFIVGVAPRKWSTDAVCGRETLMTC